MRAILIDTSGSLPGSEVARLQSLLRVGDRVIMFNTLAYDCGYMASQQDIDNLRLFNMGGTLLCSGLMMAGELCPNEPITIFTDGYIFDIKESRHVIDYFMLRIHEILPFEGTNPEQMKSLKEALL